MMDYVEAAEVVWRAIAPVTRGKTVAIAEKLQEQERRIAQLEAIPTRGDVGKREMTRDPIFLLQSRTWNWSLEGVPAEVEWNGREESWTVIGEAEGGGPKCVSMSEIAERWSDCVEEDWHTQSVWFTREEAKAFGERTAYRYSCGWRVYCICAEGELAAVLRACSGWPTGLLNKPEQENPK